MQIDWRGVSILQYLHLGKDYINQKATIPPYSLGLMTTRSMTSLQKEKRKNNVRRLRVNFKITQMLTYSEKEHIYSK